MRIGVITFHRAYNCGAMLQAWALKKVLERMGHTVEFPNCNHIGVAPRWRMPWTVPENNGLRWWRSLAYRSLVNLGSIPCEDILRARYRRFSERHLQTSDISPEQFASRYDDLVYGSDQIWNPELCATETGYFLGEGVKSVPKISYAASYGDKPLQGGALERVVTALSHYDSISVRETIAKNQLGPLIRQEIFEALDPTLLLAADDYDEIADGNVPKKPYLFLYTLFATPFSISTAKALARRLGVNCVIAPCIQYSRVGAPHGLTYSISPDRLVQYVRNAKYVLASSFHGTALGVVFNKSVLSLREKVDLHESRPAALLRKLGCHERLVTPQTSLDEMERLLVESNCGNREVIRSLKNESIRWLETQIRTLLPNGRSM